jgi:hypothetical protein
MANPRLRACSTAEHPLEDFVRKRQEVFGDLQSRTLRSVRKRMRVSGLPKSKQGKYVELLYDASYSSVPNATDELILSPGGQGSCQIARYCTGALAVDAK